MGFKQGSAARSGYRWWRQLSENMLPDTWKFILENVWLQETELSVNEKMKWESTFMQSLIIWASSSIPNSFFPVYLWWNESIKFRMNFYIIYMVNKETSTFFLTLTLFLWHCLELGHALWFSAAVFIKKQRVCGAIYYLKQVDECHLLPYSCS